MNVRHTLLSAVLGAALVIPVAATPPDAEPVNLDAVYRIKEEGLQRSQVMQTASFLTDVYGPRLTGSPAIKNATDWAYKTMTDWGLSNVHVEPFAFGRGWSNQRFVARAVTPASYSLIGFPKAWTPGTPGRVTGAAVLVTIQTDKDFDAWRGKLRGRFVLTASMRAVPARFEPLGRRLTDTDLGTMARQPAAGRGGAPAGTAGNQQEFARRRAQFFADEGVAALVEPSPRGDGGTVFVQGAPNVSRDPKAPLQAPQVVLAVEHYGRILRTLEKQIPVTLEMEIENTFHDQELNAFNLLAELPGTDKADEVVMLGAHFDSWQAGTGATDNAAGSAIMMEAMRILKATGLTLRRTVRIALWSGEEQGLLGSRAYVREHFADPQTMAVKPEHAKLSGYFNVDNGTGAIRGVYLQGNEAIGPVFQRWMEPFANLGMTTVAIRNTGGTDHVSYDAVGLPGFQFIQDPIEYDSRTHHSSQDVFERLQSEDLMRNAVIVASFVYHAATRDERLPRKPQPAPSRSRSN